MANRIVGSVYILDTGSANVPLPWFTNSLVSAVRFWSAGTGRVVLSATETGDVIVTVATTVAGESAEANLYGVSFTEMKVPVLTNGTAWIYFI